MQSENAHVIRSRPHRLASLPFVLFLALLCPPAAAKDDPTTLFYDLLVESPEAETTDLFGGAVAIDGGIIAVSNNLQGQILTELPTVFGYDASTGEELWRIASPEPDRGFGVSLDINEHWIAIGTLDSNAAGSNLGAVHVYDRSTRNLARVITPAGGEPNARFGLSLALDQHTLVVGAPFESSIGEDYGAAYVFDLSTGEQRAKLLPPEPPTGRMLFGLGVDIDEERIVVGYQGGLTDGMLTGAVAIYDASSLTYLGRVTRQGPGDSGSFGRSVAIEGRRLVVGAPTDDRWDNRAGAVYFFDAETQELLHIPEPIKIDPNARLGEAVAIEGNKVIAGARIDADSQGSAHVFNFHSGQPHHILASDIPFTDGLGISIAIEGTRVVAGAPSAFVAGNDNAGAIHVFTISAGCATVDIWEPIGALDLGDIAGFVTAFLSQDPIADCNGNGFFDLFDINIFLAGFNQGCP
jgi:hypothetical protein